MLCIVYTKCRLYSVTLVLSVVLFFNVMLSVVMLNVVKLNVVRLNVVMLSVPFKFSPQDSS
jgi:hypothetical protein